jgi:hypothetical protein
MKAMRVPPESFTKRQRLLSCARAELDAARALIANLDAGGIPACVHLARAAAALAPVTESLNDDDFEAEPKANFDFLEDFEPPGVSDRLLEDWRERLPTVVQCGDAICLGEEESPKQVERSARVVHDVLERSLRWTDQEVRRRFFPVTWPWRQIWIAAAAIVCVAVVAVIAMSRDKAPDRPAPQPDRIAPREASEALLSELADRKAQGTPWDAPGNIVISRQTRTLVVALGEVSHAPIVEISLDNNDTFRIDFLADGAVIAESEVGPYFEQGGLIVYRIEVPEVARESGYDEIRIAHIAGDDFSSVGHLILDSGLEEQPAEPEQGAAG